MTWRWFSLSDFLGVAISAGGGFLKLLKLFFNRRDFRIGCFLIVPVTGGARSDRHIGCQSAQGRGPRDVDVAGGALHDVLAFGAFVTEHCRDTLGCDRGDERTSRFMTAATV